MGINGLLPALKPIARAVHVSKYKGLRAAVDGYSWLHKGAYCCAKELCEGTWTDKYVTYFMSRIQLLRGAGVEPVVVFDGGRLPIKGDEEQSRHRARAEAREKAAAHLAAGNIAAAVECYQRCVDITPAMAKQVIEELKVHGVQFIVAPYEADAQMAYLARRGDVQLVVTEDSDLLAYACPRVLYKLDRSGSGEEVALADLPNCPGLPLSGFTSDQFMQLCVMAGCDFLAQLPGIGLKKAHGVLRKYRSFTKVVKMLRFNGTQVPPEYEVRFQLALWAFRHCRVYCPTAQALVHLAPLPPGGLGAADVDVPEAVVHLEAQQQQQRLDFLGPHLPEQVARGIAEGHLDPMTHKPYDLAAIFAGCRNPPPHIAAQLPALKPEPDPLALTALGFSSGPMSGGGRGAASGAARGKAGSGASRPRVGLSKKHSGGQAKLSWAAAAGASKGSGSAAAAAAAAGAASGGGGGKRKSTLGIAKYFTAAAPDGTAAAPAAAAAADGQTGRADASVAANAGVEAGASAGTAAAAAPAHNMQHSILQALQALRQQQQQRQQQEQAEQQQKQQAASIAAAAGDRLGSVAAAAADADSAPDALLPSPKRTRLSHMVGSSGSGLLAAAEDMDEALAGPADVSSVFVESDAVLLANQQPAAGVLGAAVFGHAANRQLSQQHQEDNSRRQQQQQQQPGVMSVELVVAGSQAAYAAGDATDSPVTAPASLAAGKGSIAARSCSVISAAPADTDDLPWAAAGGSAGQFGSLSSSQQPPCSGSSGMLSHNSRNLLGNSQDMSGRDDVQLLQQQGLLQPGCNSSMSGSLAGTGEVPDDSAGLSSPLEQQQQQQHSDPFGLHAASGQLSGQQQQQQDSDPFGIQGTASAGAAARGAAVSALTALVHSIPSQKQRQSPAAAAAGRNQQQGSRVGGRFIPGNTRCSLPGVSGAVQDGTLLDDGLLSSFGGPSSGGGSSGMCGSGLLGSGFGESDPEGLSQQQRSNPWARSSIGNDPCGVQQQMFSALGNAAAAAEEEEEEEYGEENPLMSPPKTHYLAPGGSSSQAWLRLQQRVRGRLGIQQQQQHQGLSHGLKPVLGQHVHSSNVEALGERADRMAAAAAGAAGRSQGGSGLSMGLGPLSPLRSLSGDTLGIEGQQSPLQRNSRQRWHNKSERQQQQPGDVAAEGIHAPRLQLQHQRQQHKQCVQPAGQADDGVVVVEQPAAAAAAEPGHSGGSSSNDENAEPEDTGNIHSIAHMKQYAKLATKVVDKIQQQQQQHQQVSPLGQAGSAANAAAAGPATHRPSGLLGSQAFLRNSSSKGKSSSASQRKAGTRQQQRQKSLAAELQGLRYDPSLLFVPARPLASDSGGVVSDLQAGGPHAAGSYAEQDGSVHGFSSVSRSPGPGLQGGRQQGAGASLGLSSSHCIASKPFKAPWLSQPGSADGEAAAVTAVGGSAGCFGAFGSFACGAQPAGGSTSRRLGGRLL